MSAKNSWKWNAFVEIGNTIHKMTAVLRTYKSKYAIMTVNGLIENNFISNLLINNQQLCKILLANITVSGWKYGTDSNCCQSILSFNTTRLTLTSYLTSHYLQRKTESRPDSLGMSTTELTVCCYIKTRQYRPTQYNSKDYIKTDIMDKFYKGNGSLLRKEGVFKQSYRPVNAVLSTSGYLHTLPPLSSTPIGATHSDTSSAGGPFSPTGNKPDFSADSILEMPELTLDLAEYTLLPLNLGDKDPKDIVFVGKNSGVFGRDIKHKFKGKTMVESADWWTAINEHMKQMETRTLVGTPTTQHSKPAFAGTAPLPKEGADGSTGLSQRAAASVATANAPSTSLQARLGAVVSHSKSDTIHATSGTRPVSMPAPPLPGRPKSTIVPTLRPKSGSLIDESFDDLPSRRDSLSPPISFTTTSNDQIPTPAHVADFASFPPPDTNDKTEVGNVSALSLSEQMEMKLSHATSGGHSHDDPVELDTPSPKAKLASLSTGTSNPWDTFQDESGGW
ncbi:hypothetical protein BATDEDRAFT_23199 [Batrachochytrium dendrobatidis JAM81]|uniref:PH domain-containing protein n=1 Tax=Batrachochytrium dendrobatidis (strain JAM81 / FGSC 10211) TaxID=684364 RepID=F4NX12_BATDJ|nr:uncharacterized protein BATDEDRAFT_23199 [Batrachochytrium dendrobatidis JAM81]EGF82909.1 hypothetical protein BATDEDRAFT_23199 [Batrachochytrium dendrobatidis JAM81]|eukprot:XP_006676728.1 hypothetical protein BATDEDRAFT_23199 [Batrachochytrium dendrobatidis JAM81]